MIFICVAMYCESSAFIKHYNLKKDLDSHKFQVFKNQEVVLIITGIGKVESAIAVTYLFSKYHPKDSDLLLNIGICGAKDYQMAVGNTYLCNKLIDHDSKRTFYPDMMYQHPFIEASIETCSWAITSCDIDLDGQLVDMEATGVYQAASVFLKTHQLFFIKIISDHLKIENLTKAYISSLIQDRLDMIIDWVDTIKHGLTDKKEKIFSNEEIMAIDKTSNNLRISATMKHELIQYIRYFKLQYGDFEDLLNIYSQIECHSKKEGKKYFEELKKRFI